MILSMLKLSIKGVDNSSTEGRKRKRLSSLPTYPSSQRVIRHRLATAGLKFVTRATSVRVILGFSLEKDLSTLNPFSRVLKYSDDR